MTVQAATQDRRKAAQADRASAGEEASDRRFTPGNGEEERKRRKSDILEETVESRDPIPLLLAQYVENSIASRYDGPS